MLIPNPLLNNIYLKTLSELSESELGSIKPYIELLNIYDIDKVSPSFLPWLAMQWRVVVWDSSLSIKRQREVVKNALLLFKFRGTPWAVEQAMQISNYKTKLIEWHQKQPNGKRGTFEIIVRPTSDQGINQRTYKQIISSVETHKRASQHWTMLYISGLAGNNKGACLFHNCKKTILKGELMPNPKSKYYPVLTKQGAELITKAYQKQKVINITHMALGDANGEYIKPNADFTKLENQFALEPLDRGINKDFMIGGGINATQKHQGKWIHEVGLVDIDGNLIVYGAYPPSLIPKKEDSVVNQILIDCHMKLTNSKAVRILVDPNIATVTKTELRIETPIGSVQSYLGKKLPFGWIWFAKASFDEKIFSELFDVLGTNQLPSAENRVFRGASAEMPLGTIEEDAVKSHEIDVVINDANLGTKTSSEFGHKHQTVVDEGYDGSTQAHSPSSTEPMKRAHDTNGGGSYWLSHAKEKPSTTTPTISPTNKVNQNADTNIGTHGHTATASYKGASETRVKSLRINRIIRAIPSDNKIKLKYSQTFISYFDEKDKFFIATREYTKITAIVGGKEKLAVSLPPFATEILYTQSDAGKTGVYDEKTKTWNEIKDKRKTDYFNEFGEKFNLKSPLDDFPAWAIFQEPPKTDQHKLLKYNKPLSMWEAFDDVYQRDYFEEFGQKRIVTNKYFRLKPNETFQAPPKVEAGKAVQLVAKKWQIIEDNRDSCAFAKDNKKDSDYIIQTLDPIPNTHTLEERPSDWHSWDYLKNIWHINPKDQAKKMARENQEKLAKEQSQNLIERLQSLEQELKTLKNNSIKNQ